MMNCRHGLMLIGPPYGAKTSSYRVLAHAITSCCERDESYGELPVQYFVINPKSVTLNQLYGFFDPISHDFTDGIVAKVFRNCAYKHVGKFRKWIVFDGPVDAKWIENMNTVLDDNKKLCLMNGEVIIMPDTMNLIFEANDLSQASPATVSRCGMVYMQPEQIGWHPLLTSWIITLPDVIDKNVIKHIEDLFEVIVPPAYAFLSKKCKFYVPASEVQLAAELMKIFRCLITNTKKFLEMCISPKVKTEDLVNRIDMFFLFALIWSFGAITDE
jgi:dynein heavy chain